MPRWRNWQTAPRKTIIDAPVAKLADAHASGACDRKVMEVQILSGAQINETGRSQDCAGSNPALGTE